jgi:anti-sigma B factor antagonist
LARVVRTEPKAGPAPVPGGGLRVPLDGEIDLDAVPRLRAQIDEALASETTGTVVFDLSACTFLDSSGLQALVSAVRAVEARQRPARVVGARGVVLRVLQLTGADSVLPLAE